ncbi:hypothetical protein EON67_06900, partial [archaeon]
MQRTACRVHTDGRACACVSWERAEYHSEKTGRGPLEADWQKSGKTPVMCAYKVRSPANCRLHTPTCIRE